MRVRCGITEEPKNCHAVGPTHRTIPEPLPGAPGDRQHPAGPVSIFGDELPGVEVLAKMECLNPGGSLKDRPVLHMLLAAHELSLTHPGPGLD